MNRDQTHFWLRKMHSLSGLLFCLFLLEHFFTNSFALYGREVYGEKVAFLQGLPYLLAIEVFLLGAPILFHAGYGFFIIFSGENNVTEYGYTRNWLYTWQRITGVIAFFYLIVHIVSTRFTNAHGAELFDVMAHHLTSPVVFVFYTIGIAAASFHFANGLWGFIFSWGFVTRASTQKGLQYICLGIGGMMFFFGFNALLAFVGLAWVPGTEIRIPL